MTAKRATILAWAVVYVLLTSGIGWWLVGAREAQLAAAQDPVARADWEAWKAAVEQENASPKQPVARRTPTTLEPPGLILMRDHFPAVCATLGLVWTAFFGFMAMVITGVARGSGTPPQSVDPKS